MTEPIVSIPHVIKDPLLGTTLDRRYRIIGSIGQGATSSVYKAKDAQTNAVIAIKILHSHLASDASLVARFEKEARAAQILTHPNIVSVTKYAISDSGIAYLIMEHVDGLSLQQLLTQRGWLPLAVALPIFEQICAGLSAAHEKGIVHRDVKPGNIMLVKDPKDKDAEKYMVKILDFGCAQLTPMLGDTVLKLTQTGEMLGSLLYMSPEQCLDQEVDARSDVYSLGCVIYETLTGKPPLVARTAFETMNQHLSGKPMPLAQVRPDLQFSKGIESVILKAIEKSPEQRYQQIADLQKAFSIAVLNPEQRPASSVGAGISKIVHSLHLTGKDAEHTKPFGQHKNAADRLTREREFFKTFDPQKRTRYPDADVVEIYNAVYISDQEILIEIGLPWHAKQLMAIRPTSPKSSYWKKLCGLPTDTVKAIKFPLTASIANRYHGDEECSFLDIDYAHSALILH